MLLRLVNNQRQEQRSSLEILYPIRIIHCINSWVKITSSFLHQLRENYGCLDACRFLLLLCAKQNSPRKIVGSRRQNSKANRWLCTRVSQIFFRPNTNKLDWLRERMKPWHSVMSTHQLIWNPKPVQTGRTSTSFHRAKSGKTLKINIAYVSTAMLGGDMNVG